MNGSTRNVLAFAETAVALETDVPAITTGLQTFVAPYFAAADARRDVLATLRLRVGDDGSALAPTGEPDVPMYTASTPSFCLVGTPVVGAGRRALRVRRDHDPIGFVELDRARRMLAITAPSPESLLFVGARALRDLVYFDCQARGWVSVHASAVDVPGLGVVVICGDSGGGKTSSMVRLVLDGAGYVANDRVLLSWNGSRFAVLGWPTYVSLGPAPWYPATFQRLFAATAPGEEVTLDPRSFYALVGARIVTGGTLAALVVVSRDDRRAGYRCDEIEPGDAGLERHLYTPRDPSCNDWLRWSGETRAHEATRARLLDVDLGVPILRVHWSDQPPSLGTLVGRQQRRAWV